MMQVKHDSGRLSVFWNGQEIGFLSDEITDPSERQDWYGRLLDLVGQLPKSNCFNCSGVGVVVMQDRLGREVAYSRDVCGGSGETNAQVWQPT